MEAAVCATIPTDDPRQTSFDGRGRIVKIVPVQAHAGFQAKGIAGSQTSETELVFGRIEQKLSDGLGSGRGNADLKPILARVPAAADQHGNIGPLDGARQALAEEQRLQSAGRVVGEHSL